MGKFMEMDIQILRIGCDEIILLILLLFSLSDS
jgi:hypothetical protein